MSIRAIHIITASCYLHLKHTTPSFTKIAPITFGPRGCVSVPSMIRRRSPRLLALAAGQRSLSTDEKSNDNDNDNSNDNGDLLKKKSKGKNDKDNSTDAPSTTKKKRKTARNTKTKTKTVSTGTKKKRTRKQPLTATSDGNGYLPRTREKELKKDEKHLLVIGVDEAGRGPLAGPVVAAAAIIPTNIVGVTDSKKLTKEEDREVLYEKIISSPNARWSVAIVDAKRIDEINILQATLAGMKMAASALISQKHFLSSGEKLVDGVSSKIEGSYVVCGSNDKNGQPLTNLDDKIIMGEDTSTSKSYYGLIDGNRVPKEFPCDCEAMVKGDSREYAIGAASILAKVTRDRIMREYDILYPEYELSRHKGYPTAVHMKKVRELGASPIHRRSFAPLKHMTFDQNGKIVDVEESE